MKICIVLEMPEKRERRTMSGETQCADNWELQLSFITDLMDYFSLGMYKSTLLIEHVWFSHINIVA